jgi:hypothetical protein
MTINNGTTKPFCEFFICEILYHIFDASGGFFASRSTDFGGLVVRKPLGR